MKVLQIINSHDPNAGGAEKLSLQLHRGLRARGIESHLLGLQRSPANRREGLYSLHLPSPYHPLAPWRLLRFLRHPRWKVMDVVHVHLFPAQLWFALVARALRLSPVSLTTEHNTFNRRRSLPGARVLDGLTYDVYKRIVGISDGTTGALRDYLPALSPRLRTIVNGIELDRFVTVAPKTGTQSPPIILSASRLTDQKNHGASLQAMERLGARPFRFWLAGRGEREGELRAQVRALGLEEKVELLGFRDDLPALFEGADLFLSASKWEGFGLSIAEAMAAGLPVVCSDVAGAREVVGEAGVLVDPSSPDDIAAKIGALLDDEARRLALGRAGRERAKLFDVERMIDAYAALYVEATSNLQELPR